MGRIEWIPIAEMPEALKDGRRVLLWRGIGVVVGMSYGRGWMTLLGADIPRVTHFAEINPPDGIEP